jgi:chromosome segregation ATPase
MKCPRCGKENPAEVHTCTPLALALAEMLDKVLAEPLEAATILAAAAELRRLHTELEATERQVFILTDCMSDCSKANARLEAENEALREALKRARESMADWGSYASEYFQQKHDLQGDLDAIDAALARAGEDE